jgi:ATP diphosphatase
MQPSSDVRRLIEIMAALRDPVAGCPWDIEQTFASIAPFTIEEAYEVADAIERGAIEELLEELGDLLLQVVFHACMAEEAGMFDFGGVVEAITTKLIRRHPHVFGDARELSSDAVKALWARIKADEKRAKVGSQASRGPPMKAHLGALDGVPLALPALSRAMKLQEKASKVGFDWNDVRAVLAKLGEEIGEVEAEIANGSTETLSGEVGDLLFTAVNLARHLKVDPGPRFAAPTRSSSGASNISKIASPSAPEPPRAPASTKWSSFGSKRSSASAPPGERFQMR